MPPQNIVGKVPGQMKFDFALWTTRAVQELVLRLFQVRISRNTLCRYLPSRGMTTQRPKKTALQKDPEAVEVWLHEIYTAISRRANAENAIIFWQDETGIQQDTNAVKGYSPCGQTPVIMQDRRSCYGAPVMLSAENNQGFVHFKFQKSTVPESTDKNSTTRESRNEPCRMSESFRGRHDGDEGLGILGA